MQAIVKIGSSQYIVSEGQKILVDRPQVEAVLAIIDGDNTLVGQPEVKDAKVTISDLGEVRGDKVRISTFKAKSRYRKTRGFRPTYHEIEIKGIAVKK